jgi:tetratricopeptide (TPR) repeat protein
MSNSSSRHHLSLYLGTMQERCARARKLERAGNYEAARDALGDLWCGVGIRPSVVDELDHATAAEVLLCAGAISGRLASAKQVDTQEAAKDLLSESRALFESIGNLIKSVEAQIELGHCYWQSGAFDEARITLKLAFERLGEEHTELRALALLRWAVVEKTANRFTDALKLLDDAAAFVEASASAFLRGNFHNTRGNVLKYLGSRDERGDFLDKALLDYAMASGCFEEAGHRRYSARVENNQAMLLLDLKRYDEAHEHLDCALSIFVSLQDMGSIAQVNETRARVLLAQGRSSEALTYSQAAVRTLEKGGEHALLCEALTTQAIVLARLHQHQKARQTFQRAVDVGEAAGDLEGAGRALLSLIEEVGDRMPPGQLCRAYLHADELCAGSKHAKTLERLQACARSVIASFNSLTRINPTSNLYQFPVPTKRTYERLTIYAPDDSLSGAGYSRDDEITFRLTSEYRNGDLVLALTPDGHFAAFIYQWPDGRLCLKGSLPSSQARYYLTQEVIVIGVAEKK